MSIRWSGFKVLKTIASSTRSERRVAIGVVAELYGRVGTTDRPEIKRCVDSCSASAFRFGKFATVVSESDLPDFDNAFGKYIE